MHTYETPKVRVGVIGARGYTGLELVRILLKHPQVDLQACFGTEAFSLSQLLPERKGWAVPVLPMSELERTAPQLQTLFLATPAETSLHLVPRLLSQGLNVIDLSGAFRLKGGQEGTQEERRSLYRKWYDLDHTAADLIDQADYGLAPWAGPASTAEKGRLISNPGCFATAVLMALIPLLRAQLIDLDSLVIDAKSGTTGGGRKASENLMFTEVEGECLPYKVGRHQHFPEICEFAATLGHAQIDPIFSTSLLPTRRGIIAGIYARLWDGISIKQIEQTYAEAYSNYPLLRHAKISQAGQSQPLLSLKRVVGSARTHLAYEAQDNKLFVYSSIDNLLKGAASQAVENFNRLYQLPITTALTELEGVL